MAEAGWMKPLWERGSEGSTGGGGEIRLACLLTGPHVLMACLLFSSFLILSAHRRTTVWTAGNCIPDPHGAAFTVWESARLSQRIPILNRFRPKRFQLCSSTSRRLHVMWLYKHTSIFFFLDNLHHHFSSGESSSALFSRQLSTRGHHCATQTCWLDESLPCEEG